MVNKINKTSIDFFYKLPLKNAYELMEKLYLTSTFKTGDKNRFEGDTQDNVVYHAESAEYNGDLWIEIDPENKNVAFIEGNSTPFEMLDGMNKRWAIFEDVYKYVKGLEVKGELKRLEEEYGENFGGKMNIMDENGEEPKENSVKIGSYELDTPKNPLKEIEIQEQKKLIALTVKDEKLFFDKEGTYPLIGVMGDNEREEVGTLKHEYVKDGFGNGHHVLKMSINNNVNYTPDHVVQFSNTALKLIKDNNLDIEGVLPEDKIRYNDYGMRNIILLKDGKNFFCVSQKALSMDSVRKHQEKTSINVIPSSLEYGKGGNIDISDIPADRVMVEPFKDDDFSIASVEVGGFPGQRVFINSDPKEDKALLRVSNHSPFEGNMPIVEDFFKDKKDTYVEFNTELEGISLDSIKNNGINKAKTWVINFPVDTDKKRNKIFEYLLNLKNKDVEFPERFIFNKGILLEGKVQRGAIGKDKMDSVVDGIKKSLQKNVDELTEFPEF